MPKVISLSSYKLFDLIQHFFENENLFEDYSGIKKIGTRCVSKNGKLHTFILYKVLDKHKLSYAKIKYEF